MEGVTTRAVAHGTFDVAVIGAGVVGCAVFRALVLAGARVILLERGRDILSGTSKANSAILHTGFDAPTGSVELACMQQGYAEYLRVREALGLPLLETGAFVVAWSEEEVARLSDILRKSSANGYHRIRAVQCDDLFAAEPRLARHARAALFVPDEHIIDPWSAPLAYALHGLANGGVVKRNAEVTSGRRQNGRWMLATSAGPIDAATVVNCAGLRGDLVEAIARPSPFTIKPRKGQFLVYDKPASGLLSATILPVPTARTKGVVLVRTVFGNVLVGPTAEDQDDRDDTSIDTATLQQLAVQGRRLLPALADVDVIAAFAGVRPASNASDYVIEALPDRGWITVGGIRSTGLSASLGIAKRVECLYRDKFADPALRRDVVWVRVPNISECARRDYEQAGTGEIVCHCELVTRREVENALSGPLPAGDLGGLKRRTRAMLGRCQGFYCTADIFTLAGARLHLDGRAVTS